MFYIIIFIVLAACAIYKFNEDSEDIGDYMLGSTGGLLMGLVVGLVINLFIFIPTELFADQHTEIKETQSLEAIQDNMGSTGSFFLGSGYYDSEMKYVYVIKENEGFKMKSVSAKNATIVYSSELKIEEYEHKFNNVVLKKLFGFPLTKENQYKVYVPNGTIKNNFNIDLQ